MLNLRILNFILWTIVSLDFQLLLQIQSQSLEQLSQQKKQQFRVYSCVRAIAKAYADMKNITSAILLENLCLTVGGGNHIWLSSSPLYTFPACLPPTHRHLAWLRSVVQSFPGNWRPKAALLSLTGRGSGSGSSGEGLSCAPVALQRQVACSMLSVA